MTGLNLLPRKCFELVQPDGTIIHGQFGTWALSRFTQKKNIGLEKITEIFANPVIGDLLEYVLCAIEQSDRENGRAMTFNDVKLCKWVDNYTEDTGEDGVIMKLLTHAGGEEKKNQIVEPQLGEILSDLQPAQV